jgi:enterochelin esterase-like enzyme
LKRFNFAAMKTRLFTITAAVLISFSLVLDGQTPPAGEPPAGRGGARGGRGGRGVRSPEINADRTVTLRLNAPKATEVRLLGTITGDHNKPGANPNYEPLTKDANGVWSVTVGPLEPEIYDYYFNVDGANLGDPQNRYIRSPGSSIIAGSQVEVPGNGLAYYDAKPVPHGQVRMFLYESKTIGGAEKYMWVYTPPGYDNSTTRYPAMYLMHGGGNTESGWIFNGRANLVMDNLIAEGKAKPMVIVMPSSRAMASEATGPEQQLQGLGRDATDNEIVPEIVPLAEKNFRIIADADSRALVGLSQGGRVCVAVGLHHTDVFHWIAPLSAGGGSDPDQFMGVLADVFASPEPLKKNLRLLWFIVGADDPLKAANEKTANALREKGVTVSFKTTPGVHEWKVWRQGLYEVAPLLFSSQKSK